MAHTLTTDRCGRRHTLKYTYTQIHTHAHIHTREHTHRQTEYKKSSGSVEVLGIRMRWSKLEAMVKDELDTYQHIYQQRVDHFLKVCACACVYVCGYPRACAVCAPVA